MRFRTIGVLPLFALLGCVAADDAAVETAPTNVDALHTSILGGTPSDDSQNAVVMLVTVNPTPQIALGICTATLIAPRLVITARHCVANANENVACLSDGTPQAGGQIAGDYNTNQIFVFVGKDRPNLDTKTWTPSGSAVEIIDDESGNLCNHDIALVVLKDPITNIPPAPIRLDADVAAGESLLTVGWGVSSDEVEPSHRQQRNGVTVKRVGPNDGYPTLTKNEILFDESICLGDSGGPIFSDSTKAVLAVVSRGGNGGDSNGSPASTCVQADNLGTRIAPFKDIVMKGFDHAGAQPTLEVTPDDKKCGVCGVGASTHLGSNRNASSNVIFGGSIVVLALLRRLLRRAQTREIMRVS